MEKSKGKQPSTAFKVSLEKRPDFEGVLCAVIFDSSGNLISRAEVRSGEVKIDLPESVVGRSRVFIAPVTGNPNKLPTLETMNRLGAYQAIVSVKGELKDHIRIPGVIIDNWLVCACYARGQVVRSSDNSAVCGARVHICEVDKLPLWILKLPEADIFRLRDDLLDVIDNPTPRPPVGPIPETAPDPFPPAPHPMPDPAPIDPPVFRFSSIPTGDHIDPEPEVSFGINEARTAFMTPARKTLNEVKDVSQQPITSKLKFQLKTPSATVLKNLLATNWELIYPWLCIWPWWRLRCDEVAVVTSDSYGRFESNIYYPCTGDRPDLYFWVEYDFGSGYETIHNPSVACHTYWDFSCGSEITIRVSDARVPGCTVGPDLPGCQVVIKSIGNKVAVKEVNTNSSGAAQEGLLNTGGPFGSTLEPRVDYSRTCLIDTKEIPYYRWSYRRLSGPDGVSTTASTPPSVPISTILNTADAPASDWVPMTRVVVRHYRDGTSYPADPMGPMPTGPGKAPIENLFRIRPANPPTGGSEWVHLNEHVDQAEAYFETARLRGAPANGPTGGMTPTPAPDDLAAGRYELKLELFDKTGNLVNWTSEKIDLRIANKNAPFDTSTVTTSRASDYNRIFDASGDTIGFKMVVRVDNNYCYAEVLPVAGDVTPDSVCGFHNYETGDNVRLRFIARHPNHLARYTFNTFKASRPAIGVATTSGVSGAAGTNGYLNTGSFQYEKDIAVSALLATCPNAAFAERLDVEPMAQDGYVMIRRLRHTDTAAFALAQPCPLCPDGSADPRVTSGSR